MAFQPKLNFPPIRALLIDISGTLLIGSSPTHGAAQALAKLRAARIPFRLCSNTSKESSNALHERMRAAGLDVRREELWTSIGTLRAMLKGLGVKRPYMLLSKSALEECTDDSVSTKDDCPSSHYDAVVVGLAPQLFDYDHLNTAFRILVGENRLRFASQLNMDSNSKPASTSDVGPSTLPRPPLIALHKARYIEAPDHALSLGPGPFVHALEDAAGTSATIVGKPTRAFFETVLNDLECDLDLHVARRADSLNHGDGHDHTPPARSPTLVQDSHPRRWEGIAVIGDDVFADLGDGAIELGLWRVLVKTGKYRLGDEGHQDALPPDQVCASFAEFVEMLVERRKTQS